MKWKRTDIINLIADKIGAESYLEIGVQNPDNNFNKINIDFKIGVDPYPTKENLLVFKMKSDDFFEHNAVKFDLIFIDGDHSHGQSLKDVRTALKFITSKGVVVMHDCNPSRRYMQVEPKPVEPRKWCGGCWKTFATLRMTRKDLYMAMVPDDLGCGIIRLGGQICYPLEDLNWKLFSEHKQELMNIIGVEQLKEIKF